MLVQEDRQVLAKLCRLTIGFVILLIASCILLNVIVANVVAEETAVTPPEIATSTTLWDRWQNPAEILTSYVNMEMASVKIAFYNADGVFSLLDSGDDRCPNQLIRSWCDDLAIP